MKRSTPKIRWLFGLLAAAAICGCRTPDRLEFFDDTESHKPTILSARSVGDRLFISIIQGELPNFWISGINAEVLGGDVYLSAIQSKVPVQTIEFSLDLGARRFPRDWQERLYWITAYQAVTNMSSGVGRVTGLYRFKLRIQKEENPAQQDHCRQLRGAPLPSVSD